MSNKIERLGVAPSGGEETWKTQWMQSEIERLRREFLAALRNEAHYAERLVEAERRIEELEKKLKRQIDNNEILHAGLYETRGGVHVLTDSQIDAAWMLVMDTGEDGRINSGAEQALRRCGIVRCEGCGGEGWKMKQADRAYRAICPDCAKFAGHGWVIE